ncbi:hypothetical protein TeGR_g8875 [Tetraparma gracilis]|uniref:Uncharacterized protein n=1 Tax=Tetraparma gracilis TaxID=2962635 RepID=A0ABQ6N9R2_9STRA|nr:hypothetical protein TeGR_g8875 [Tetraparma gracilis]
MPADTSSAFLEFQVADSGADTRSDALMSEEKEKASLLKSVASQTGRDKQELLGSTNSLTRIDDESSTELSEFQEFSTCTCSSARASMVEGERRVAKMSAGYSKTIEEGRELFLGLENATNEARGIREGLRETPRLVRKLAAKLKDDSMAEQVEEQKRVTDQAIIAAEKLHRDVNKTIESYQNLQNSKAGMQSKAAALAKSTEGLGHQGLLDDGSFAAERKSKEDEIAAERADIEALTADLLAADDENASHAELSDRRTAVRESLLEVDSNMAVATDRTKECRRISAASKKSVKSKTPAATKAKTALDKVTKVFNATNSGPEEEKFHADQESSAASAASIGELETRLDLISADATDKEVRGQAQDAEGRALELMSARVDLDKTTMVGEVNLAIAKGSVDESAPDATEARAEVSAATERLAELETSAAEHAAKAAKFQLNAGKLHSKRLALVETRDMLDESVKLEEGFAATKHATISKYSINEEVTILMVPKRGGKRKNVPGMRRKGKE